MIKGVDVSDHQPSGQIDWASFAGENIEYMVARATYGTSQDSSFNDHVAAANHAAIITGAYHFYRYLSTESPAAQANAFLTAVSAIDHPMLLPSLDLESNAAYDDPISTEKDVQNYQNGVAEWIRIVEAALSRQVMIYTNASFSNEIFGASQEVTRQPLWVASYTSGPAPSLPEAWSGYAFWQYSGSGQLAGYEGPIDLDRFNGNAADLQKLVAAKGG